MSDRTVWEMVKEAVEKLNDKATYSEIYKYIWNKWGTSVNKGTITDQIQVLTVNHNSRIHYPENHKPRLTNSNNRYDLLFTTDRGKVVKYNPSEHGIWEIFNTENKKLAVRKFIESNNRKIFTPSDIIWIKNVTNKEGGQAYMNLNSDEFVLHFPNKHGETKNIFKPKVNELILIRQKINNVPSFTHLVTPIDNERVDDINNRNNYRFGRTVRVIAKTELKNYIPVSSTLWKRVKFSGIAWGNACEIENISNKGNIEELKFDIWDRFSNYFVASEKISVTTTDAILSDIDEDNPELSVPEGKLKLVSHYARERNQEIVRKKKQQAIKNNTLKCEVCVFSFQDKYAATFIECHHLIPIGTNEERETTLKDLALVCSNCHRMLHKKLGGSYLTIDQLQKRIESLRQ